MEDVLALEEALEKTYPPTFSLRPDLDEANMNYYQELLGDAMPVKLSGSNYIYFMPWDDISFLRGMTPIMYDLYDRPDYLHRIMDKLCSDMNAQLDFIEQYAHVEKDNPVIHCTPGYVSGLAEDGWKATWFRGAAQPFTSVSPKMLDTFEIQHILPIAQRFAYTYYGCCEPLDKKIPVISKIPNLRKIGVSPWSNVDVCAEQIGSRYVFSRKPNPAHVAVATDPEVIRRETEETVRACIRNGCPCDITLKDISTVSHKPQNLILWAQTVSDVLDAYYGAE